MENDNLEINGYKIINKRKMQLYIDIILYFSKITNNLSEEKKLEKSKVISKMSIKLLEINEILDYNQKLDLYKKIMENLNADENNTKDVSLFLQKELKISKKIIGMSTINEQKAYVDEITKSAHKFEEYLEIKKQTKKQTNNVLKKI